MNEDCFFPRPIYFSFHLIMKDLKNSKIGDSKKNFIGILRKCIQVI